MKLNVNLITKGHFWDAGVEVPDHLIPVWCIKKHRIGDVEAAEICQRREELRAEARERAGEGRSQEGGGESSEAVGGLTNEGRKSRRVLVCRFSFAASDDGDGVRADAPTLACSSSYYKGKRDESSL